MLIIDQLLFTHGPGMIEIAHDLPVKFFRVTVSKPGGQLLSDLPAHGCIGVKRPPVVLQSGRSKRGSGQLPDIRRQEFFEKPAVFIGGHFPVML